MELPGLAVLHCSLPRWCLSPKEPNPLIYLFIYEWVVNIGNAFEAPLFIIAADEGILRVFEFYSVWSYYADSNSPCQVTCSGLHLWCGLTILSWDCFDAPCNISLTFFPMAEANCFWCRSWAGWSATNNICAGKLHTRLSVSSFIDVQLLTPVRDSISANWSG